MARRSIFREALNRVVNLFRPKPRQTTAPKPPQTAKVEPKTKEFQYEEMFRKTDMRTEPAYEPDLGKAYIDNFIRQVNDIYLDTIAYIQNAPRNENGNIQDEDIHLISLHQDEVTASYHQIINIINIMRDQFGDEAVAKAIASDVELDYVMALVFAPPSSCVNNFEATIEELTAVTANLYATYGEKNG